MEVSRDRDGGEPGSGRVGEHELQGLAGLVIDESHGVFGMREGGA